MYNRNERVNHTAWEPSFSPGKIELAGILLKQEVSTNKCSRGKLQKLQVAHADHDMDIP